MQNEVEPVEGVLVVQEFQTPRDGCIDQTKLRNELAFSMALSFQVRREIRLSYENGLREGYRRAAVGFGVATSIAVVLALVAIATVHP